MAAGEKLYNNLVLMLFVPSGAALTAGETLRPQFRPPDYTPALHFLPPPPNQSVFSTARYLCATSVCLFTERFSINLQKLKHFFPSRPWFNRF